MNNLFHGMDFTSMVQPRPFAWSGFLAALIGAHLVEKHMHHDHGEYGNPPGFWGSRYSIGLIVIGAVAGYFLLTEHLAHVVGALPFLLLLSCPLMHVFMHRGHGGHGHHHGDNGPQAGPGNPDQPRQGEPS